MLLFCFCLYLFIYLFIHSKVQKSGIWLGLVKFERPTDVYIEMSKSHWDLCRGEILTVDIYLDSVNIMTVSKH